MGDTSLQLTCEAEIKTAWNYTHLASSYDARPDYATSAVDDLLSMAALEPSAPVADIGAGTGKLTKLLLERGLSVHAVEPNDAMCAFGVANTEGESVRWSKGTGERNGLPDRHYGLITFGSSFNVTNRQKTLVETARESTNFRKLRGSLAHGKAIVKPPCHTDDARWEGGPKPTKALGVFALVARRLEGGLHHWHGVRNCAGSSI